MKTLHSKIRLGILLLVLSCSMGVTAQTNKIARSNRQLVSIQSSIKKDSISGRKFTGRVFDVVETPPSFPGGQAALMSWLSTNMQYPPNCVNNQIQGRVILSFIVEPDGSLSTINVLRKVDPELDEEAVRLVKAMPKWNPGKQNGQAVRVKYNIPISFKLQ